MHRAGDCVTPTLQGQPWLEKPPLYYWLAAGAFASSARPRRRPASRRCWPACWRWGSPRSSARASTARPRACTPASCRARAGCPSPTPARPRMDMLLAATVTGPPGSSGLRLLGIAGRRAIVGRGVAAGLATLAKGPLGLLLPVLVGGGLRPRHPRVAPASRAPRSAADRRVPGRGRALVRRDPARPGPPLPGGLRPRPQRPALHLDDPQPPRPVLVLPPGPPRRALPLVGAGGARASSASRRGASRSDLFVLLWLGLPLAFFSLAGSKLPGYILPCVPPLAILMGRAADRLITAPATPERMLAGRVVALVGLVLAAWWPRCRAALAHPGPAVALGRPARRCGRSWSHSSSRGASGADPAGALRLLRIGAAGLLVLLALAAPPILEAA